MSNEEKATRPAKVVGIGLNKTGTKTLGHLMRSWGYRNRTYDSNTKTESHSFDLYKAGRITELLDEMEAYDSFEDWPWPLLYREIDARYPDARFILTTRKDSETWYRSLCKMTARLGPLPLYEKTVYGYAMPHGRRKEYIRYYEEHNAAVRDYFKDRPEKLLHICWEEGHGVDRLANFLGTDPTKATIKHINRSPQYIYGGDNLYLAYLFYYSYRIYNPIVTFLRKIVLFLKHRLLDR